MAKQSNRQQRRHPNHPALPTLYPSKKLVQPKEDVKNKLASSKGKKINITKKQQ